MGRTPWPGMPVTASPSSWRALLRNLPRDLAAGRLYIPEDELAAAGPRGSLEDLLTIPLDQRLAFDPEQDLFFVNFEGYSVKTLEQVEEIRDAIESRLDRIGRKVYAIVNYENFEIYPEVVDFYTEMVRDLVERRYSGVSRYTTSAFLRMKLGERLKGRDQSPHIYWSQDEARKHLEEMGQGKA